jgi:hypothetical protein
VAAMGVKDAWDAGPGQTLHKIGRRGGPLRFHEHAAAATGAAAGAGAGAEAGA